MTDFIREVDEEVRQDKFRRFLDRYWILILAFVLLVLIGVGAWRAYDYYATQKAEQVGGRYLDALDLSRDGKPAEAAAALGDVAKAGSPGYQLLARFRLAADTGTQDPVAGAKLFDQLAADSSVQPALQNLARLRAAVLLLDGSAYPEIKSRLEPLADANNILRNSARELLAVAAIKAGQYDEAGRYLDAIETDPTTSNTLRQRAEAMLGIVRSGPEKNAEAPAVQPSLPSTPPPQSPDPQPAPAEPPAAALPSTAPAGTAP